jgi:hypothetical protein
VLRATLGFETTSVVAVGSSVNIEEGIHLAMALMLIVMHLRTLTSLLLFAVEAVELRSCSVIIAREERVACSGDCGCGGLLCILFLPLCLLGIVGVGVVAPVDLGVVAAPLALWWWSGTRRARAGGYCSGAIVRVSVKCTD